MEVSAGKAQMMGVQATGRRVMKPVQQIAIAAVVLSVGLTAAKGDNLQAIVGATDLIAKMGAISPSTPPESQGLPEAPIGHRQPNARNVPASVLHKEQMVDPSEVEFDKKLQICRSC
jgi:hypothetical protein